MIKMKIHSVIDVITNSSTEIYSYVDGNVIGATYDMLDAIIKSVGSDKKARDMFDVTAGPDVKTLVEHLYESENDTFSEMYPKLFDEVNHWEVNQPIIQDIVSQAESDPSLYSKFSDLLDDEDGVNTTVHISAKNGDDSVAKAVEEFLNHFHSEEYSC